MTHGCICGATGHLNIFLNAELSSEHGEAGGDFFGRVECVSAIVGAISVSEKSASLSESVLFEVRVCEIDPALVVVRVELRDFVEVSNGEFDVLRGDGAHEGERDAEIRLNALDRFVIFNFSQEHEGGIEAVNGFFVVPQVSVRHAHEIESLSGDEFGEAAVILRADVEPAHEGAQNAHDGLIIAFVVGVVDVIEELREEFGRHFCRIDAGWHEAIHFFDIVDERVIALLNEDILARDAEAVADGPDVREFVIFDAARIGQHEESDFSCEDFGVSVHGFVECIDFLFERFEDADGFFADSLRDGAV